MLEEVGERRNVTGVTKKIPPLPANLITSPEIQKVDSSASEAPTSTAHVQLCAALSSAIQSSTQP